MTPLVRINNPNPYPVRVTSVTGSGTIDLDSKKYAKKAITFSASTLVRSGNSVQITLGVPGRDTETVTKDGTTTWVPLTGGTDRAGDPLPITARSESGPNDVEF